MKKQRIDSTKYVLEVYETLSYVLNRKGNRDDIIKLLDGEETVISREMFRDEIRNYAFCPYQLVDLMHCGFVIMARPI